jgi:CheY-like chemotaxis protein
LVAEDDLVNQKVILRQLHLLGHAAEIAESGVEALRMWQTGGFALLLTDLHMPDMDGYTLAESIRREESERGNAAEKRLPILALTANALRGEALRAKAVGMDEYLTKPLQLHLLKAALDQWLPTGRPELSGGALQASVDDTAVSVPEFDVSVLEELVGAEPAVVREFLVNFRSSAQKVLTEFADAQAVGAVSQISAIAHKLKSSSRSVGAMELGDRCAELENACRMGTGDFVAQSLAEVKSVLSRVEARIDDLLGKLDG